MPITVTEQSFSGEVLEAKVPVLVDFWAEWCGPCKAIAPILAEISTEMAEKVKIVKLNVDENPGIAAQYGIRSIPTMILFKNGAAADMKIGAGEPKASLVKWLEGHAKAA
jgi:thioredoxin